MASEIGHKIRCIRFLKSHKKTNTQEGKKDAKKIKPGSLAGLAAIAYNS